MNHRFKVKYGFKSDNFISIEAGGELEKAIHAWQTGSIATLGGKMINGNNIISIEPDYHYYTGWYDHYLPTTGDDYAQIERDCPDYDGVLDHYRNRVQHLLDSGRAVDIGKGVSIPLLDKPKENDT
jgi:hypothetical protein